LATSSGSSSIGNNDSLSTESMSTHSLPQLLTPEHDNCIKKWLTDLENDPDLSEDKADSSNKDMIEDGDSGDEESSPTEDQSSSSLDNAPPHILQELTSRHQTRVPECCREQKKVHRIHIWTTVKVKHYQRRTRFHSP
jgi:hypothetical protein